MTLGDTAGAEKGELMLWFRFGQSSYACALSEVAIWERSRQKDHKFEVSMGFAVRLGFKTTEKLAISVQVTSQSSVPSPKVSERRVKAG